MSGGIEVKRALISVSDKEGLEDLAKELSLLDIDILSTGGTKNFIEEIGVNVTDVSSVTGFPEILDGRVKTLHPNICLLYTSPSPRDRTRSRMPSSA